jgi:hypothetical protein
VPGGRSTGQRGRGTFLDGQCAASQHIQPELTPQTTIFQEILEEIVLHAMNGLIEGKELFTDSTFLKANANKSKFFRQMVRQSTKNFVEELGCAIGVM